jgi:hypothetical protein
VLIVDEIRLQKLPWSLELKENSPYPLEKLTPSLAFAFDDEKNSPAVFKGEFLFAEISISTLAAHINQIIST